MNHPQAEHWFVIKQVLRYLFDLALMYTQTGILIHGFSDADWASDTSDHHSYTGYAYLLEGAAISWKETTNDSFIVH